MFIVYNTRYLKTKAIKETLVLQMQTISMWTLKFTEFPRSTKHDY